MAAGSFAAAINCMDGRVQEPVANWIKARFHVDYVDEITEPGPDRLLADREPVACASIRHRLAISVEKHGSHVVALVAHHDCTGNPVDMQTHLRQLDEAIKVIGKWQPGVNLVGLWVDAEGKVEQVHPRPA